MTQLAIKDNFLLARLNLLKESPHVIREIFAEDNPHAVYGYIRNIRYTDIITNQSVTVRVDANVNFLIKEAEEHAITRFIMEDFDASEEDDGLE
jgi:hypothetical protein